MNIKLQANGTTATNELRHFAGYRADMALGAFRDRIERISLFVDEPAESNHTAEVRCLVVLHRIAEPDLVVEGRSSNMFVAIHQTLDKAGWRLANALACFQNGLGDRQFKPTGSRQPAARAGAFPESDRAA